MLKEPKGEKEGSKTGPAPGQDAIPSSLKGAPAVKMQLFLQEVSVLHLRHTIQS